MKQHHIEFIKACTPLPDWAKDRKPSNHTLDIDTVRFDVLRKLARVQDNPTLYADKIAEYEGILAGIDRNTLEKGEAFAMMSAMLVHGDASIDSPSRVGVLDCMDGTWGVFGYV